MKFFDNQNFRKSHMILNEVYFWTDTIKDWRNLLSEDKFKEIIIDQLQWLKDKNKIAVYGFVIMPNHLHIIWEMLDKNGKEMPYASFNKWTASNFLKKLRLNQAKEVAHFEESTIERNHRFWQRDPLAVLMDSREKLEQKLDYIHLKPLQEKWSLVDYPEKYKWSSAKFYESGEDEFGFLTHYMDRLG